MVKKLKLSKLNFIIFKTERPIELVRKIFLITLVQETIMVLRKEVLIKKISEPSWNIKFYAFSSMENYTKHLTFFIDCNMQQIYNFFLAPNFF